MARLQKAKEVFMLLTAGDSKTIKITRLGKDMLEKVF
jgi:hypothetical protein